MNHINTALSILDERFGQDILLALATIDGDFPNVRTVNAYYENGCFYIITHALSGKIKQIKKESNVGISGEWFTALGKGENLGWIRREENSELANKLRNAFADWYGNGHIDESDKNTVILCIHLNNGVLFSNGTRYDIDFIKNTAK